MPTATPYGLYAGAVRREAAARRTRRRPPQHSGRQADRGDSSPVDTAAVAGRALTPWTPDRESGGGGSRPRTRRRPTWTLDWPHTAARRAVAAGEAGHARPPSTTIRRHAHRAARDREGIADDASSRGDSDRPCLPWSGRPRRGRPAVHARARVELLCPSTPTRVAAVASAVPLTPRPMVDGSIRAPRASGRWSRCASRRRRYRRRIAVPRTPSSPPSPYTPVPWLDSLKPYTPMVWLSGRRGVPVARRRPLVEVLSPIDAAAKPPPLPPGPQAGPGGRAALDVRPVGLAPQSTPARDGCDRCAPPSTPDRRRRRRRSACPRP